MTTTSTSPPGGTDFRRYKRPVGARKKRGGLFFRSRAFRRKGASAIAAGLALLAVLIGLFLAAPLPSLLKDDPAPPPPAISARWLEVTKPFPLYSLIAPQIARLRLSYSARRHSSGGGREDALTFGEFNAPTAFLRLSVYRHGAEWTEDSPFFVDMARRAAPLGLSVQHEDLTRVTPTRFGEFETAALGLAATQARRDNCLGFRMTRAEPGVTIGGLACAAGNEPFAASDLACLINRLDLLSAADDKLRVFFAASLARGTPNCPRGR